MKKYLIIALAVSGLLIGACSKDKSIETSKSTLGNDSLVTRLSLKITDKNNLVIKSQLFKDSKSSYLISGLKDKKYWIGYFDKSGNQLFTKTYTDDPTEMTLSNGSVIKLPYILIFPEIKEIGKFLFINRWIREVEPGSIATQRGFVENLTQLNTVTNTAASSYHDVAFGTGATLNLSILPWYNNQSYIISRMIVLANGDNGPTTDFLYNADGNELSKFSSLSLKYPYATPISDTEYLSISTTGVARINILNSMSTVFATPIFTDLPKNLGVTLIDKSIVMNMLTVTVSVTYMDGIARISKTSIDINTGKIL